MRDTFSSIRWRNSFWVFLSFSVFVSIFSLSYRGKRSFEEVWGIGFWFFFFLVFFVEEWWWGLCGFQFSGIEIWKGGFWILIGWNGWQRGLCEWEGTVIGWLMVDRCGCMKVHCGFIFPDFSFHLQQYTMWEISVNKQSIPKVSSMAKPP